LLTGNRTFHNFSGADTPKTEEPIKTKGTFQGIGPGISSFVLAPTIGRCVTARTCKIKSRTSFDALGMRKGKHQKKRILISHITRGPSLRKERKSIRSRKGKREILWLPKEEEPVSEEVQRNST